VVGNAGQGQPLAFTQLAGGQGDAEQRRNPFRVLAERLEKITEPEEYDSIRMLSLDPLILLENGSRLQRRLA
jgi:hypothetical protein